MKKQARTGCAWFALCTNPATGTRPHVILGQVPICDRCRAKVERIERLGHEDSSHTGFDNHGQ